MTEVADPAPPTRRAPDRAGRRADVLWCLLLAVLGMGLATLGVVNGPGLSALDEHTHLDYAWKVAQGELPRAGSELSDLTLEEWSCRGQENIPDALPECAQADDADAADYPAEGENYNYWHPPGYYAVTAVLAELATALPLGLTFTTAARLTGGLWLVAALVGMYAVVRMWRLPRWLSAAAAATMLGVPSLAHASSTVTNDAPAALIGVGALWLLTRVFLQGRLGLVAPTVVALLAASTKLMSTVAVLTVLGLVALSAVGAWRRGDRREVLRRLGVAVVPVVAIGASAVAWSLFQAGRAEPGWSSPITGVNTVPIIGAPFDEWAPTLATVFGLVEDYFLQGTLTSTAVVGWIGILGVLFTAAPFMALVAFDRLRPERWVGWAALVGAAAVPLLVQGNELLGGGYFPHVSSRYGVTLVPLTIAALVLVAHEKGFRVAAAAVAVVGYLAMALSFAGIF
ncbi:hypothetical protein [Georgenia subflava]|uniref:Glycosyltransferase RgtA/B/C/D-like domain-containing protein n=1 Tax=Georgenia subflava TaxID=1622177 RepID=A0A6N7ES75_9MICO|nr:hypothetical protein [Georgenia subflava]MPV38966.1 hypothetical protein [Georgenia subflava]